MRVERLHGWKLSIEQAMELQRKLAGRVCQANYVSHPSFIAGVDMSVDRAKGTATAAVVVLNYPELKVVETKVAQGRLEFPYVPGLLSFREAPLILTACECLNSAPDLVMVDGQGIAHPRRMGIASHLGLFLNTPTIGCAKSLLLGTYEIPGDDSGSYTPILDRGETIGAALRTKSGVNPLFVSIGHKVDLLSAMQWVLACCRGYRLPEPSRLAHLASQGSLKVDSGAGWQTKFFE